MDPSLGVAGFVRQLGAWSESGRVGSAALAGRVRTLLDDGRLTPGTRVPSERELAVGLGLGRGSVAAAYEQLRESGHLVRRRGSGTWTALPEASGGGGSPLVPFAPTSGPGPTRFRPGVIDLAYASPPAPVEAMTAAAAEAVEALPAHLSEPGYDLFGLPVLRTAIAERLSVGGLPTAPDEVMVTAGSQHAHSLIARALVRPGDRVVLEQPTYPNAIDLVRQASARPVPLPLGRAGGRAGWDVGTFAAALRESTPAVAYLIPDHQNPTGAVMEPETRLAVAAAARRHGVPLVVDECLREMWLDGSGPPPPLARGAGGAEAPVLTIGSMSKTVWGGLRIGWIRGPRSVLQRVAAVRPGDDIASPVLEQILAVALLRRLDDLLPARRAWLAARRDHLLDAIGRVLPSWSAPRPVGGLSLWVDLGAPRSTALVEAAARHGVHVAAGPRVGTGGAVETFLRIPFIQPPDVLDDAVARLGAAWTDLDGRATTPALRPVV